MEPISRRTLLSGSALAAVSLSGTTAYAMGNSITRWISQNARPITDLNPGNAS